MSDYKLTQEEKKILDAFESEKIQPIPNAEEEIKKHRKYATGTLKKDKRIGSAQYVVIVQLSQQRSKRLSGKFITTR